MLQPGVLHFEGRRPERGPLLRRAPALRAPPTMKVFLNRPIGIAAVAAASLLLSVFFFAPRLSVMSSYSLGATQWVRGHNFLLQCEDPFRRDVEPALHWRLLPPLVAQALQLRGNSPLVLPWIGILALIGYSAVILRRRRSDARFVFGGTVLIATTAAVLVPVGWLGVNDAWVWLGLLAVAFGRSRWALPLSIFLCPWIDERFIIGLPLAWVVRCIEREEPLFSRATWDFGLLLVYAAVRIGFGGSPLADPSTGFFLFDVAPRSGALLPLAAMGWWMGLRAGWLGIGYALHSIHGGRRTLLALTLFATLLVSLVLAADISRSAAIALPVVILGCSSLARSRPDAAPQALFWVGLSNLVLPAAHVVYKQLDVIDPLLLELVRLWRGA